MTTVLTKPLDLAFDHPIRVTLDVEGNRVTKIQPKTSSRLQRKLNKYGAIISHPTATSPIRSYSFLIFVFSILLAGTISNFFSPNFWFYGLLGVSVVSSIVWVYTTVHKPRYIIPDSELLIDAYNDVNADKNTLQWHRILFAYALYATAHKLCDSQFESSMWGDVVREHDFFVKQEFEAIMSQESFPNFRSLQEFFPSDQEHLKED